MGPELWGALIGALATIVAGLIPFYLERRKRRYQKYKFVYVKVIHLRRREHGRPPVYRASLRRLAGEIDVFDEYHFFRLNVFHRPQKEFRFSDRTSGAVDLQIIYPWQDSLRFADRGAGNLVDFVEQTITTKSDVFLTKSIYYNALQDGHEDIAMKLEQDTDEARIILDFSSLPGYERALLSMPVARLCDVTGNEVSIGVIDLYPGVYAIEVQNGKKGQVVRLNFAVNWDANYIFGYGSLINRESASRALEEPSEFVDLYPALLKGYRRAWTVRETVFSRELGQEVEAAFLDIREVAEDSINGVLVPVDHDKLRRLSLREKNYELIDVTDKIELLSDKKLERSSRVFTFKGKPEHHVNAGAGKIFVLSGYREKVKAGCEPLGKEFVRKFEESTDAAKFADLGGAYSFIDRAQARYV